MSIIKTPGEDEATGETAAIYAQDLAALGYVPEHTRVMAVNAGAHEGWTKLASSIAGSMGMRRYELVTLAAALGLESRHCRLAHGQKALKFIGEPELVRIARDYRNAGLDEAEVAMMDFALKLSTDATSMDDSDTRRLREAGFTDREIVDIALAAAARNFFSRFLQALAVDVDVPPNLGEELRTALLEPLGPGPRPE
ncbi:carboxymuconolactone decarboxylase family protein [Paeniglutamicibacter sp. R2-26]|uniref:carboxymuconolactone decarboxylase family protein n=1 Tax=Paeniglutamicibacter sp. R2-26 TaxID=3144417 RepID=UPI003EE7047A